MYKHTKRYMIISESWRPDLKRDLDRQVAECDTLEELAEYEKMVIEMHKHLKKPATPPGWKDSDAQYMAKNSYKKPLPVGVSIVYKTFGIMRDNFAVWDCCEKEGARCWGFVTIDFEEEKFLRAYGDGLMNKPRSSFVNKNINDRALMVTKDYFFRQEHEIPKDYKWDGDEEWVGWLRFRFGDGKNAIGYVEEKKTVSKQPAACCIEEASEDEVGEYIESSEQAIDSPFASLSKLLK